MAKGKHTSRKRAKRKFDKSQLFSLLVIVFGFVIAQEAMVLMYLCIKYGYSATAAWLTAAVGLAEAIIGTGLAAYLSLAKSDHKVGGITYEKAKANNFQEPSNESPQI